MIEHPCQVHDRKFLESPMKCLNKSCVDCPFKSRWSV
jgi:hypothetical protein